MKLTNAIRQSIVKQITMLSEEDIVGLWNDTCDTDEKVYENCEDVWESNMTVWEALQAGQDGCRYDDMWVSFYDNAKTSDDYSDFVDVEQIADRIIDDNNTELLNQYNIKCKINVLSIIVKCTSNLLYVVQQLQSNNTEEMKDTISEIIRDLEDVEEYLKESEEDDD